MSFTPEQIKRLVTVGVTAEQLAVMVEIVMERDAVTVASRPVKSDISKEAIRSRRYRAKKAAAKSVTQPAPVTVENVTPVTVEPMGGRGESSFLPSLRDSGKKDLEIQHAREPDEVGRLVEEWNLLARELGLPQVGRLNDTRRKAARKRLAEIGGLAAMIEIAWPKIRGSPGLQGKADGTWRANFDWLLQPSSFTKLIEGGYDNWRKNGKPTIKESIIGGGELFDRIMERESQGNRGPDLRLISGLRQGS